MPETLRREEAVAGCVECGAPLGRAEGPLCQTCKLGAPPRTCPACGAYDLEIRKVGHRLVGGMQCPEACTCIPEHFSMQEHRQAVGDEPVPKIFLYIKERSERNDWVIGAAMAEDGRELASVSMSSHRFLTRDLGRAPARLGLYRAHYPAGYQLVEVWNPEKHEGLQAALRSAAA